jgi:hypothetical protein
MPARENDMKAILFPFGPTDSSTRLPHDFPELEWIVAASPEDVARAVPDTAIYVTSNRTCNLAIGQILQRAADRRVTHC